MASGRSSHSSRLWHTMLPAVKEPRRVPALVFASEVEATLLRTQRLQQLDDLLSLEVLCPSERGGPVYGISGRQVRSALDEQFHHPDAPSARRPMERSPSPVEARRLRVDVGTAVEQIRSSLDAAAEDRVDQRLLQALVGWRFSEHWSVYRWVMASRTRQQTAISVKEAREQIGPSHACGKFQVQGGALPHKSLSNLLTLIPYGLGERTPVITQSIHRRACVDEELGQDGIVAARYPLQSRLSRGFVARAGIHVRPGADERLACFCLAPIVSGPIAQVKQQRAPSKRSCIRECGMFTQQTGERFHVSRLHRPNGDREDIGQSTIPREVVGHTRRNIAHDLCSFLSLPHQGSQGAFRQRQALRSVTLAGHSFS